MSEPRAALGPESGVEKTPCSSTRTSSFSSADGADFDGIRRVKRPSVASQVTFAGLFGDADDDEDLLYVDDASTEPGTDDVSSAKSLFSRRPNCRVRIADQRQKLDRNRLELGQLFISGRFHNTY